MKVRRSTIAFLLVALFACIMGLLIAVVDTSPNWNDTAITAFAIFVSSFIAAFSKPRQAWLWAIIIGGLPFLLNVVKAQNYQSALALVFSFVGAYSAFLFRHYIIAERT